MVFGKRHASKPALLSTVMWCTTCQQDSPEAVQAAAGPPVCGVCGKTLIAEAAQEGAIAAVQGPFAAPLLTEDDWMLEAELRGALRMIGSPNAVPPLGSAASSIEAPHAEPGAWHAAGHRSEKVEIPRDREAVVVRPEQSKGSNAAWAILSLSLAAFACGAVLLAWSYIGRRDDLWPVGMPLTLVGQAGLILGLILQLDGLWHSNRQTASVLTELDSELSRVRQATTLLSTSRTSAAQSFYVHLADGAPPQLLLADLKGQLDLLAQQMSKAR